jgi:hypothetical protein
VPDVVSINFVVFHFVVWTVFAQELRNLAAAADR